MLSIYRQPDPVRRHPRTGRTLTFEDVVASWRGRLGRFRGLAYDAPLPAISVLDISA